MITFTQDNINLLTDYILNNDKLKFLVQKEDWGRLYEELSLYSYDELQEIFSRDSITPYLFKSFLYHYFKQLDEYDILTHSNFLRADFFRSDEYLKNIEIPSNIVTIGQGAFSGCTNLETVTFQKDSKLFDIYKGAFAFCHNLKKIAIPPETSRIGDDAFYGDNSLEEISMYSKVKQIGPGAINYCTGLRKINYTGTVEQFQKISQNIQDSIGISNLTVYCSNGNIRVI